jgi:hypothetical protein
MDDSEFNGEELGLETGQANKIRNALDRLGTAIAAQGIGVSH